MLLMDYPSIGGEDFPDYSKKDIYKLSYSNINAYSQRLIDEYPGDGVQTITIF